MADPADAARAADWYLQTARLRATTITEGAAWFAVHDPGHPRSHEGNQVVVHSATDDDLIAIVAANFPDSPHQALTTFADIPVTSVLALQAAGFGRTDFVLMTAHPDDVPRAVAGSRVEVVTEAESSVFAAETWRLERPDMSEDVIAQLVHRRLLLDLAGRVHRLAVRDAGRVVATCDVVVRGATAELDAVAVGPAHRQRGIGDALVAAAGEVARSAGVDLLVLTALAADWPREWYSRRGYEEVGAEQSFVAEPDTAPGD